MKRSLYVNRVIYYFLKFMKYSILVGCIIFSFCSLALANSTYSQKALNRTVTLQLRNVSLEDALEALTIKTGVKIAYANKLIKPSAIVNEELKNEKLKDALSKLLSPFKLSYVVVENIVVLMKTNVAVADSSLIELAAEHDVRGIVTDSSGIGLQGVTV